MFSYPLIAAAYVQQQLRAAEDEACERAIAQYPAEQQQAAREKRAAEKKEAAERADVERRHRELCQAIRDSRPRIWDWP